MALKWALLIYVVVVETRNFKGFAKDDEIEIILKSHLESDLLLFTVWTPKWWVTLNVRMPLQNLQKRKNLTKISRNLAPVDLVQMNIYQSNT